MRTTPGWRRLLDRAMQDHAHLPETRFVQLATIRADGRPANRTLVFRDWLPTEDHMLFITDLRSAKVSQIGSRPWAEVCWYFVETREQFRILGQVSVGTDAVEYLDLRDQPHLRRIYRRVGGDWTDDAVNP